jgi:hypothetical protein
VNIHEAFAYFISLVRATPRGGKLRVVAKIPKNRSDDNCIQSLSVVAGEDSDPHPEEKPNGQKPKESGPCAPDETPRPGTRAARKKGCCAEDILLVIGEAGRPLTGRQIQDQLDRRHAGGQGVKHGESTVKVWLPRLVAGGELLKLPGRKGYALPGRLASVGLAFLTSIPEFPPLLG